MSNENEILTIAGKLVKVAYCKHEEDACERCCLLDGKKCLGTMKRKIWDWPCMKFGNDQKNAYFVEAEQPEEKDYKRLYEELVNSEWYKKYYKGASVGDSVAVEQPEADFETEYKRYIESHKDDVSGHAVTINIKDLARHFAEWERKRTLDKVVEWMKANLTYTHPRKGVETCMVNIPAFLDTMNEENT